MCVYISIYIILKRKCFDFDQEKEPKKLECPFEEEKKEKGSLVCFTKLDT